MGGGGGGGLWTTRHKFSIEGAFPKQPADILFKINVLMQRWRLLLKEKERTILNDKVKTAEEWLKEFMKDCKKRTNTDFFSCNSLVLGVFWGWQLCVVLVCPASW